MDQVTKGRAGRGFTDSASLWDGICSVAGWTCLRYLSPGDRPCHGSGFPPQCPRGLRSGSAAARLLGLYNHIVSQSSRLQCGSSAHRFINLNVIVSRAPWEPVGTCDCR